MDALEETLKVLNSLCAGMDLTINVRKTKVLPVRPTYTHSAPPRSVREFEDLGRTISQDCFLDHEVDR